MDTPTVDRLSDEALSEQLPMWIPDGCSFQRIQWTARKGHYLRALWATDIPPYVEVDAAIVGDSSPLPLDSAAMRAVIQAAHRATERVSITRHIGPPADHEPIPGVLSFPQWSTRSIVLNGDR